MTLAIKVKERGTVPRKLRKVYTAGSKAAWADTAKTFHTDLRDKRFTEEHARAARYQKRTLKYLERKQKKFGHTRPLEYTGETRRAVKTARITSTSKGGKTAYAGARKLNFRASPRAPNAAKEFRHLTAADKKYLAKDYDKNLDRELNADQTTSTRTL